MSDPEEPTQPPGGPESTPDQRPGSRPEQAEQAPAGEPAEQAQPQEPPAEPPEPRAEEPAIIPVSALEAGRLVQLEACTRCGECLNWCPVYDQDARQDILPRRKAQDFLRIIRGQHGLLAKLAGGGEAGGLRRRLARLLGHRPAGAEEIRRFAASLYECSTCGQCQVVCPANLDTVNLWESIRRIMVMAGYGPLEQQQPLVKSVKAYDNPWQQPRTARAKWTRRAKKEKLIAGPPKEIKKKGGKILLYLGCTASYDTNVRQVAVSTVNILDALGVDYGFLGNDEACCGSVMLRMGDPEFERVARHNIELFNSLGIEALVTSCSGCFKTIREDYPQVGRLNFEVMHTAQFLARLLDQHRLDFQHPVERVVTYHDPCHLGRASGVFDEPRLVMEAIPGLELIEMPRHREYSRCCGAGGGLKAGYPDIQNKMAQERVREAEATGAQELVSCCPFCFQGLQVGIASAGSGLVARDLSHHVEAALGVAPQPREDQAKPKAKPAPAGEQPEPEGGGAQGAEGAEGKETDG